MLLLRKGKRIIMFFIIYLVTVPCFAIISTASTVDSTIPVTYIGYTYDTEFLTDIRQKENSTSVYIKNDSNLYLHVETLGISGNQLFNDTKKGFAHLGKGQYQIHNWIYENGRRLAMLSLTTADYGTYGFVHGKWSPDSVGTFPVPNK